MPNDSELQQIYDDTFYPERIKLKCLCTYFLLCDGKCLHGKEHYPLFKGRFKSAPSTSQYKTHNCVTRPGRVFQCPAHIPDDRICIATNEEHIAHMLVQKIESAEKQH